MAPEALDQEGIIAARMTLRRRVEWPTRVAAEKTSAMVFKNWDPRVLKLFNEFALYPYPTPENKDQPTRLTTNRFQEMVGFMRPSFIYSGEIINEVEWQEESKVAQKLLEYVPCSVFYICGGKSLTSTPETRKDCELNFFL